MVVDIVVVRNLLPVVAMVVADIEGLVEQLELGIAVVVDDDVVVVVRNLFLEMVMAVVDIVAVRNLFLVASGIAEIGNLVEQLVVGIAVVVDIVVDIVVVRKAARTSNLVGKSYYPSLIMHFFSFFFFFFSQKIK